MSELPTTAAGRRLRLTLNQWSDNGPDDLEAHERRMRMVTAAILDVEREARSTIDVRVRPRVGEVPGQLAAFGEAAPVCVRCGRELKHPEWLNGAPFGYRCMRKELVGDRGPTRASLEVRSDPGGGDAPLLSALRVPMPPGGVRPPGSEYRPEREAEPVSGGGQGERG